MLDINRHINNFSNSILDKFVNNNIDKLRENIDLTLDELSGRNKPLLPEFIGKAKIKMYEIYIDKILLPITPEKIEFKNKNMNKTYELVNGSEFNILKEEGLKTISFECLLPSVIYPFSMYKNGFKNPEEYINELIELKERKKSFKLKIIREEPYDTNLEVSLEEFSILEDASEGRDIILKLSFKEFKPLEVQTINEIKEISNKTTNVTPVINNEEFDQSYKYEHPKRGTKQKQRPVHSNKTPKKSIKRNKKNAVQTSRKHTGNPKSTKLILMNSGKSTYTQTLPAHTSW